MKTDTCPFCKEEILVGATICKHCSSNLYPSREARIAAKVMERIEVNPPNAIIPVTGISRCEALCYANFENGSEEFDDCMNSCNLEDNIGLTAEKIYRDFNRELTLSIWDVIWGGGDIDPLPFEKAVRERFLQRFV